MKPGSENETKNTTGFRIESEQYSSFVGEVSKSLTFRKAKIIGRKAKFKRGIPIIKKEINRSREIKKPPFENLL